MEDYLECDLKNGKLQYSLCGRETMCKAHIKNGSYCFCPTTGEFMTKTSKCTKVNVLATKVPLPVSMISGKQKFSLHVSERNSTTSLPSTYSTTPYTTISANQNESMINVTENYAKQSSVKIANSFNVSTDDWPVLSIVLFVFLVIGLLVCFCSKYNICHHFFGFKKKKSGENKTAVVSLNKIVMQDQRYTTNPQYSSTQMDIPVRPYLNRNSITDLEKIGEGFFGEVYRGQLHSIDDEEEHVETVAVKRLKRTANAQAHEDFMREVEIIGSFHHPNILTLVGVCPPENGSPPWMIFEYMSFGDLADVLRNSNEEIRDCDRNSLNLSAEELLSISSQIAAGMEYLAAQRFVHRDLACRNCLVGSGLTVKISDFGMSRDIYTCDYYRVGGNRMLPIRWMSPEALTLGKFTLESDVWSYGVVLWEIYSYGKQPYYGYTNEQAMKLIADHILLEVPENCPNEISDIMRSCWQIVAKSRIQFLDICNRLSALKECIDDISIPPLPRPPPMPITIKYPLSFDDEGDDELDDILDDDNYLRPMSTRSSVFLESSSPTLKPSSSSFNIYTETLP